LLLRLRLLAVEQKILEREESQSAGVGIEAERTDEYQELAKVEVADEVIIWVGGHYEVIGNQ
jgi:hypothetical protein